MKIHLVTVGEPKLAYAKLGWEEYIRRLQHYHQIRVTHLADKWAYDTEHILAVCKGSYLVALEIKGKQFTNEELAIFLSDRAQEGRELCFIIGGPDGLPEEVRKSAQYLWSFSSLTFPHDLAMVVLSETLYRSSTIQVGHPYHRG